jgi:hypothetical protein
MMTDFLWMIRSCIGKEKNNRPIHKQGQEIRAKIVYKEVEEMLRMMTDFLQMTRS